MKQDKKTDKKRSEIDRGRKEKRENDRNGKLKTYYTNK